MVYGSIKQSAGHIHDLQLEEGHGTTIRMYICLPARRHRSPNSPMPPLALDRRQAVDEIDPGGRGRHAGAGLCADTAAFPGLRHAGRGQRDRGARDRQCRPSVRSAVHRRDRAGRHRTAGSSADEMQKIKPRTEGAATPRGYTENAIIHHGRLDEGVLLLAKPYRKSDMAIMIRTALRRATARSVEVGLRVRLSRKRVFKTINR